MSFFLVKVADEIEAGDVEAALKTSTSGAVKAFRSLPSFVQTLLEKLFGQEEAIVKSVVASAATYLSAAYASGGLTNDGIKAEAKVLFDKLSSLNIETFTVDDLFSELKSALDATGMVSASSNTSSTDTSAS